MREAGLAGPAWALTDEAPQAAGAVHAAEGEGGWDGDGPDLSLPPSLCSHVDTKELCGRCPALQGPGLGWWGGTRGSPEGTGGRRGEPREVGSSSSAPDLSFAFPQITLWTTWAIMRTSWPPWRP